MNNSFYIVDKDASPIPPTAQETNKLIDINELIGY